MSQANMVPNGVPPQFKPQINGIESTHSSASSSPSNQMYNRIPPTQLPPAPLRIIPTAQLPPAMKPQNPSINQITQNYANLNLASNITPLSSPKKQIFSTSTPIQDAAAIEPKVSENLVNTNTTGGLNVNFNHGNNALSPISLQQFTHSANSQFSNVPNYARQGNNSPQLNTQAQAASHAVTSAYQTLDTHNKVPSNQFQQTPIAVQQLRNGGSLTHQHSLPANALPLARPTIQPSLSQPRLMGYSQNVASTQQTQTSQINKNAPLMNAPTEMSQTQNVHTQNQYSQHLMSQTQATQMTTVPNSLPPQQKAPINYNYTNTPTQASQNQFQQQPINPQVAAMSQNTFQPQINSQIGTQFQTPINSQVAGTKQFQAPINSQVGGTPQFQPSINSQVGGATQFQPPNNSQVGSTTQFKPLINSQVKATTQFQQAPINSQVGATISQTQFQPSINTQVGGTAQFQPTINSQVGGTTQFQPSLNTQVGGTTQFKPPMNNSQVKATTQFQQAPINSQVGATISQTQFQPAINTQSAPVIGGQGYATNQMPPHIISQNQTNNRPPNVLSHQQSTPNLYNKQMPPKTNSLPGPQDVGQPSNQMKTNVHTNRYPVQAQFAAAPAVAQTYNNYPAQQQQQQQQPQQQVYPPNVYPQTTYQNQPYPNQQTTPRGPISVTQSGFNKLWGAESFDLMQTPQILPETRVETPKINLGNQLMDQANCSPDIFRCTMTKIPESSSLLQKSRLPLGVLIHPFRDLNHLPVIQCNSIVRCRACRTYINPFVFFVDSKRWKCNLCYRVNELPEEFQYDPVSKSYGDPSRRPEVKASTIEYIAPAEYMLRPPQPAVYLYLLDISRNAIESGYLHTVCSVLAAELPNLPGDARTHIGFIAFDSALHFFSMADGLSQPHEMTVLDIDDIFLPMPDNLLCNLQDRMELVSDLLAQLPDRYNDSYDTGSALGAALQAAHKMMAGTGGRVTVFQASLPTVGPGALLSREDPSQRAASDAPHLNPANDFYKRLALECSGQQIAVDLFLVNSQYIDLATLSGISRFSGGCIYHFPLFKASRVLQNDGFERCFKRYLSRKIGFEAVMRIRCTRGLAIHTFHGNFFVRSTDLLSLPNINPDAGFGMQVAIEESLSDVQTVCFQAALLYTSSKGERRIRVHTMCLPVVATLTDVINSADQQCIIGLLSKMAVDRSMQTNLADAREAFINVAIDILSSYKLSQNMGTVGTGLLTPRCLLLLPLYISALLKNIAFRVGISTRLDDRVKAMCDMKTKPLPYLIQQIYPDLYPVHALEMHATVLNEEEEPVSMPPRLQLSARSIDSNGAYLLDLGEHMVLIVCAAASATFLNQVLGVADYNSVTDQMYELPVLENEFNQRLHLFINYLNDEKPMNATIQIIRENSPQRTVFIEKLIEDRVESALSYHEFLQHLKTQVK